MPQRHRLYAVATFCALLIAALVAFSSAETPSESSGAAVPSTTSTEPQRAPEPAVDLWSGIEKARAINDQHRYFAFLTYVDAIEEIERQEAAAAAERERKRKSAAAEVAKQKQASQPAPTYSGGSGVWHDLAACESGGNWSINTGNGYYGGLQFKLSTWQAHGGTGYPHEHSPAEQIRVAENLRAAAGGFSPWPHCSKKLGLPR